jgi:hypothetical protein
MAEAELQMSQDIKDAAEGDDGDWKAKAFIMERRRHPAAVVDIGLDGLVLATSLYLPTF